MKFELFLQFFPRIFPCLFLLWCACLFLQAENFALPGAWRLEKDGANRMLPVGNSAYQEPFRTAFPGGLLLYKEQARYSFRPSRRFFDSSELSFEILVKGPSKPLKAWIFCKDKDGAWFQSEKEFRLVPGKWTVLSTRIDLPGRELLPVGHAGSWDGMSASSIFAAGLSIYSEEKTSAEIVLREPLFRGKRFLPETDVFDWTLPEKGRKFSMIRSAFRLTREYFNPFDPDEIAVDVEVRSPDGKIRTFPAFYTVPYFRNIHFTRETYSRAGLSHWEFRYLPMAAGEYAFRIRVTDSLVPGKKCSVVSSWKKMTVSESNLRGPIRVSKKNPRYFEYSNGDFYFPVGINIHTNTDQRAEDSFGFGHLPDRGNTDYEEYIRSASRAGLNMMEVWMAAWTYALEWSSSRVGYTGLGRYNTVAAYRLDLLLSDALKHGILINLVLNNHGVLTDLCDPEWYDSPFNSKGIFAAANGAFLDDPTLFWSDPRAIELSKKKLRYTCARWGAYPNIFAMELWSEVDLVRDGHRCRQNGSMISWHKTASDEIKKNTPGSRLVSTHVCSEVDNLLAWRSLTIDPKELDHVCCDAYRDRRIPIDAQILKHQLRLSEIRKPVIITEYGGTSAGSDHSYMLGDIHGGVWTAFFSNHAGTPLLWWHDFIHLNNYYRHYAGFVEFSAGVDLRSPKPEFGMLSVTAKKPASEKLRSHKNLMPGVKNPFIPDCPARALYFQSGKNLYAWIYDYAAINRYPDSEYDIPLKTNVRAEVPCPVEKGLYLAMFYNTVSGKMFTSKQIVHNGGKLVFSVPDFRADTAVKILFAGKGGGR